MDDRKMKFEGSPWGVDIRAGAVVTLVAIPLCLGIALASGAPLMSGLITGIIGGIVVSAIGGTSLLVSGPAAGLAAIVVVAIHQLGFQVFLAAVVLAGLMQIGLGLLRTGGVASLAPGAVITGMLAAIGVLLILQQFPYAIGTTLDKAPHGYEVVLIPFQSLPDARLGPVLITLLSLTLMILWDRPNFAKARKIAPGPLVAVVVGTLAAELLTVVAPAMAFGPDTRVNLPDLSAGALSWVILPDFTSLASPAVWRVAVTLALVASLETLLSMEATDQMDPLRRRSNGNRELIAQGVGNSMAGMVGGLPMTGVIVRSAANIAAGGRTWRSAFVHGVLLAVAVVSLPWLLERIPLATLASILLYTGYKLAAPSRFRSAFRSGVDQGAVLVITVGAVILTDLLIGVGVGLAASGAITLYRLSRHGVRIHHDDASDGTPEVRVTLTEAVAFVHKGSIAAALQEAPDGARVTVDGTGAKLIDHDIIELLHRFTDTARDRGITYETVGVPKPAVPVSSH